MLDYREHDRVTAAISHLPHLVASSLVNLVKDSDSRKASCAGSQQAALRTLPASPPALLKCGEQICMTNAGPIGDMLEQYIGSLQDILDQIRGHKDKEIYRLFEKSRSYRDSITDRAKGPIEPSYEFSVDVVDEVGSISTIAVILAAKGISIKNIGINNNREHGEGALKIAFYDEASMKEAWERLEKYKFELVRL